MPLMRRAYELWRDLEAATGEQILHITGSLDAGPPGSSNFEGSVVSCNEHNLPHEVLTSAELTKRFPGYRLPSETMSVFQEEGGFLLPERCIKLFVERAQGLGATVRTNERTLDWQTTSKRRARPNGARRVRSRNADNLGGRVGVQADSGLGRGGGSRAPGAGVDRDAAPRTFHARQLPGVQPDGR